MRLTSSYTFIATSDVEEQLIRVGKESEDQERVGYGDIYWNPKTKQVWYSAGDWAEKEPMEEIRRKLEAVAGVAEVKIEAEAGPPEGKGWVQLFPKRRSV